MHINISQGNLMAAISTVIRAVPSRPNHPVLASILFVADKEAQRVTLTAFDLSLGIRTSIESVEIFKEGAFAFPATLLENIISKIDSTLEITVKNEVATIDCDCGSYEIRGMDFSKFPMLPEIETDRSITVPPDLLGEGLRNTTFAAGPNEAKQVLAGVHLKVLQDSLEFAATDSHKLSVARISNTNAEHGDSELVQAIDELKITLSISVAQEILRHIQQMLKLKKLGPVAFKSDGITCSFQLGDTFICGRVLNGQYPDYPKLIPPKFARSFIVSRVDLLSSIERIKFFSEKRNTIIKMSVDLEKIIISANNKETGSAKEFVKVSALKGKPIELGLNAKYIAEILKTANSKEVEIQTNQPTAPIVFRPIGSGDILFLVMPVNLRHLEAVA